MRQPTGSAAPYALPRVIGTPYENGWRAGYADHSLGYRSDVSWQGVESLNPYAREYSRGYREGWYGVAGG